MLRFFSSICQVLVAIFFVARQMLPTIIVDIGSLAWKVQTQFCVGKKEEIIFDNAAGLRVVWSLTRQLPSEHFKQTC